MHISSGLKALKSSKKVSGKIKIVGVTILTSLDNKKFFEHFKELNYRILISLFIVSIFFTIVYINYGSIYEILTSPLLNAGYSTDELVAFTIYEGFHVKVLNTFFVSIVLSIPIVLFVIGYFFFIWLFIVKFGYILFLLMTTRPWWAR